jgi:predicted DCC family thiol-disulfide oxidoreductase YuxK
MERSPATDNDVWLVYDDQCPVCRPYCKQVELAETTGKLHLVDARKSSALMDEITAAGLDIDQGMVVKVKDTMYYGADAIHAITQLSRRSGLFNRVNRFLFGSKFAAKAFYPAGKAVRNLLLKMLGIKFIENLKQGPGGSRAS